MTLQEILFRNHSIPTPCASRSIRGVDAMGMDKCHDGKQSELTRCSEGLKPNERRVLKALRRHKREMSADEISQRLSLSKSYCNVVLVNLYEIGKVKREKLGNAYIYQAVKIYGA